MASWLISLWKLSGTNSGLACDFLKLTEHSKNDAVPILGTCPKKAWQLLLCILTHHIRSQLSSWETLQRPQRNKEVLKVQQERQTQSSQHPSCTGTSGHPHCSGRQIMSRLGHSNVQDKHPDDSGPKCHLAATASTHSNKSSRNHLAEPSQLPDAQAVKNGSSFNPLNNGMVCHKIINNQNMQR